MMIATLRSWQPATKPARLYTRLCPRPGLRAACLLRRRTYSAGLYRLRLLVRNKLKQIVLAERGHGPTVNLNFYESGRERKEEGMLGLGQQLRHVNDSVPRTIARPCLRIGVDSLTAMAIVPDELRARRRN